MQSPFLYQSNIFVLFSIVYIKNIFSEGKMGITTSNKKISKSEILCDEILKVSIGLLLLLI